MTWFAVCVRKLCSSTTPMRVKREVRGVADARRRRFGVREPAQGSSRTRQRARLIHTQARSMETPASKGISLKFEPHRFETGIFSEHAHRELEVFLIKRGRLRVASHHRLRNDIKSSITSEEHTSAARRTGGKLYSTNAHGLERATRASDANTDDRTIQVFGAIGVHHCSRGPSYLIDVL